MATIKDVVPIDTTSLSGVPISDTQAGYLGNTTTAGTVVANACIVANSNRDISNIRKITLLANDASEIALGTQGIITSGGGDIDNGVITGFTFSSTTLTSPTIDTSVGGTAINSVSNDTVLVDNDVKVPTSAIVKDYVDTEIGSLTDITLNGTTTIDNAVNFSTKSEGTATAIDWSSYNRAQRSISGNTTYTFSNDPIGPTNLILVLIYSATATATLPAGILWLDASAPDITADNTERFLVSLYWDGSNYYGSAGLFG